MENEYEVYPHLESYFSEFERVCNEYAFELHERNGMNGVRTQIYRSMLNFSRDLIPPDISQTNYEYWEALFIYRLKFRTLLGDEIRLESGFNKRNGKNNQIFVNDEEVAILL